MTIEERLENLEKELGRVKRYNRWMLGAILVLLAGLGSGGVFKTTITPVRAQGAGVVKEIRANRIVLENEKDEIRADLKVINDEPTLALYDRKGIIRAVIHVFQHVPGLALFDEKGNGRMVLNTLQGNPSLLLIDEKGNGRVALNIVQGIPGLTLLNDNEMISATLTAYPDYPNLKLFNKSGEIIWSAIK